MNSARRKTPSFYFALTILSAIALTIESYLETQGKSFCKTQACEVVGNYLRISESLLVTGGAFYFWLLSLSFFFTSRYPGKLKGCPYLLLFPAIAFDSAIISCQIFTIQQLCLLCLSVAVILLTIAATYCISQKSYFYLFCCILTWLGGATANGILEMPEPTQAQTQMIFYEQSRHPSVSQKEKEIIFIFSMTCPHCFEIISYLADNKPINSIWKFASIDQDDDSLQKIAAFLEKSKTTDNPFLLIKEAKLSHPTQKYNVNRLKQQTKKTLTFLANTGFKYVPLLLVKESETEEKLLLGTSSIMKYLQSDL